MNQWQRKTLATLQKERPEKRRELEAWQQQLKRASARRDESEAARCLKVYQTLAKAYVSRERMRCDLERLSEGRT